MHNYFFKYISDHLYRDKFKDSDIYSYNHKLIKSYDSHNYDKLLMTASLHSKSLYKFINRSHLFRDRNYSVNIKSSQKYSLRCQKYYMIMFHYQRRYIHYKNKLFSYRKFLINSNKKRNTIRNHLMLLINIYKKDKNFLNNMSMHVRLCYLKYMLWNKLSKNSLFFYLRYRKFFRAFKYFMAKNCAGLDIKINNKLSLVNKLFYRLNGLRRRKWWSKIIAKSNKVYK